MKALKHFRVDFVVAAIVLLVAFFYDGMTAVGLTAMLIIVEIVFSFDNAAVNAKYLVRLNEFWQKMFLTVGVLVAVFGMRLVFPFLIVCISGSINPVEAMRLALAKGDAVAAPGQARRLVSRHCGNRVALNCGAARR